MLDTIATPTLWAITIAAVLALLALDFVATRKPARGLDARRRSPGRRSTSPCRSPSASRSGTPHGARPAWSTTPATSSRSRSASTTSSSSCCCSTAFAVPEVLKQRVLLYGIVGALVLRGIFIALGAAALSRPSTGSSCSSALILLAHRRSSSCATRSRGQEHEVDVAEMRVGAARAQVHAGDRRLRGHPLIFGRVGAQARPHAVRSSSSSRSSPPTSSSRSTRCRPSTASPGPLPGLRHQRLRPARPAGALLRARGRARPRWCTSATASPRSSASSASSSRCTGRHLTWSSVPEIADRSTSLFVILGILAVTVTTSLVATRGRLPEDATERREEITSG